MDILRKAIVDGSFLLEAKAHDLQSIFQLTLDHVISRGMIPEEHRDTVEQALWSREQQISTAIGHSVAVPHAYLEILAEPVIVFVKLARPLFLSS